MRVGDGMFGRQSSSSLLPSFHFGFLRVSSGFLGLTHSFHLTRKIPRMQAVSKLVRDSGYNSRPSTTGAPALALRLQHMATILATVEAREVLRCEHCSLVQFRT